jgi:hypothetical protein
LLSDGFSVQLLLIGEALFFVIELKCGVPKQDNITQLFAELLDKPTFFSN